MQAAGKSKGVEQSENEKTLPGSEAKPVTGTENERNCCFIDFLTTSLLETDVDNMFLTSFSL